MIKELAEEFEKQFICLGESTDKYITFSIPIQKEVSRINKWRRDCKNHILHITYYNYNITIL